MTYAGLVLANLGRNKLRTALTGGAVMLAVVLVCLLLTMPAGLDALLDRVSSNTRISVHNKAGIVYPMPYAFTRKVRQVDGVAAAVSTTWFGGAYEEAGKVTFPNFAVEVEHIRGVYPDYPIAPEQLNDFERFRDAALVGRQTMQKYRWHIGDRITLRSTVWPVNLDFRIVGEIADDHAPYLWFNREYLDQALRAAGRPGLGITGMIWVRAGDPNRVNSIMREIDDMSRNSEAETACETEKSFFSNFFGSLQGLVTIILIVTGLVTLCIVFIAANTASMAVRERSGELAVLKAIGFGRSAIFGMLLAEAAVLSVVAGGTGVLVAVGLTRVLRVFAGWSPTLGPLGNFMVTPAVVVDGVFLSLFVGMLAGVVQALHEVF
jgi:putative ABC transport system permease protein